MSKTSSLVQYAIGVVAEHKPIDSRDVSVAVVEHLGAVDGELSDNFDTVEANTVTSDGESKLNTTRTSNVLTATWLPKTARLKTAPDVRKGERVLIWKMENTNRYFWEELGLDPELRKLESVIYIFSANPNESVHEVSIDSCYFFEVNTRTGTVTFSTSAANGEVTRYLTQFNAMEGTFTLSDSQGNINFINSVDGIMQSQNSHGSNFILNGPNITAKAPTNIILEAGADVDIKAGSSVKIDGGGSTITLDSGALSANAPQYEFK